MMHEQNENINKKININKDNQIKSTSKKHIYYLVVSMSDGLAGFSAQSYIRLNSECHHTDYVSYKGSEFQLHLVVGRINTWQL